MKTRLYVCDRSGGQPVQAVDYSDDDDFDMPLGWGELSLRWREPNPDFVALQTAIVDVRGRLQALAAAAAAEGATEPTAEFEQAEQELRDLLEDLAETPQTTVGDREFHLAPASMKKLVKFIEGDR